MELIEKYQNEIIAAGPYKYMVTLIFKQFSVFSVWYRIALPQVRILYKNNE
jgi:hypothetical protein